MRVCGERLKELLNNGDIQYLINMVNNTKWRSSDDPTEYINKIITTFQAITYVTIFNKHEHSYNTTRIANNVLINGNPLLETVKYLFKKISDIRGEDFFFLRDVVKLVTMQSIPSFSLYWSLLDIDIIPDRKGNNINKGMYDNYKKSNYKYSDIKVPTTGGSKVADIASFNLNKIISVLGVEESTYLVLTLFRLCMLAEEITRVESE